MERIPAVTQAHIFTYVQPLLKCPQITEVSTIRQLSASQEIVEFIFHVVVVLAIFIFKKLTTAMTETFIKVYNVIFQGARYYYRHRKRFYGKLNSAVLNKSEK
jgi:hypothetical protein